MKRSSGSLSLVGQLLIVLVPLALLAALAWRGARAQERAVWEDLGREAELYATAVADRLARRLPEAVETAPRYPDPPAPGSVSPMDLVLDGSDIPALKALRDSPEAGNSPAGLPRRALATLRIMELAPQEQPPKELEELLVHDCPSILTETGLAKLDPEGSGALRHWRRGQKALALLDHEQRTGWILEGEKPWWLERDEKGAKFIAPETVQGLISGELGNLQHRDFLARLSLENSAGTTSAPFRSAPVAFARGLRVDVSLKSPESVAAAARGQERRIISLVALAAGICLWGLLLIQRTLQRERKLNEMKSQFVASVSHELRAPVASIRLMADALEEEKVPPETAKEFHRLIAREGARLSTLVGNVLDHARIEQGRKVWKMESCDLAALVKNTLRVMEPLAKEREISLEAGITPVESSVDADSIQQALVNLLDNAIKFSPKGSTIFTSLSIDEVLHDWTLSVNDPGPGIPEDEQARIFERFYRPGDELRRETQGTGIGLSLVKSIAEAHGGTVIVASKPGEGSTFTLRIPISA
ncbi:sensor histidine kinase [Luteolibacter luteus]|uniref:histidine kinase n=1 Tax=Luteolibacter luteus TaxID=2728835 RepID=A0A858RMZ6_9BACT|nr:HAMP domain-containing sensor histidine kinase [Luteolibacter luteus]QJE97540.1 HAMP domain-containing histidine kinase [Luteolibacter luteus]